MVILPVDQGFEHGPARSFAPNPAGYDPRYHFQLAHRRRLQRLRGAARLPRGGRRRVRRRDPAHPEAQQLRLARRRREPCSAITGSVDDALRLGCVGDRLHDLSRLVAAQRRCTRRSARAHRGGEAQGPRGGRVVVSARRRHLEGGRDRDRRRAPTRRRSPPARRARRQGEAADGAHRAGRREEGLREGEDPDRDARRARAPRRAERLRRPAHRHLLGRRGEGDRRPSCDEIRAIRDGGGFGSIIGRNSFQRPKKPRRSSSCAT